MEDSIEIKNMLEELAEEIEPHLPVMEGFLPNLKSTDKPLSIFSMASFFPKVESIRKDHKDQGIRVVEQSFPVPQRTRSQIVQQL